MRYKINEINKHRFIQVPIELFENPRYEDLNNDARMLYAFLLDRMELSRKNNWINENDEIYLIYPRADIEKILHVSNKTCVKMFKQLNNFKLIEEERQGLNRPNKIYINHIIYDKPSEINGSVESTCQEVNNVHSRTCNNYTSGSVKNTCQEVKNVHAIYTNINQTIDDDDETFSPAINKFIKAKGKINQLQREDIKQLVNTYSLDFVLKAMQVTSDKANSFNMSYIKKVLKSYKDNGYQTLKDIEDAENAEDVLKDNVNRKRKKNMIKQLETAPVKKSKSKNTPLEGDVTYAEINNNSIDELDRLA